MSTEHYNVHKWRIFPRVVVLPNKLTGVIILLHFPTCWNLAPSLSQCVSRTDKLITPFVSAVPCLICLFVCVRQIITPLKGDIIRTHLYPEGSRFFPKYFGTSLVLLHFPSKESLYVCQLLWCLFTKSFFLIITKQFPFTESLSKHDISPIIFPTAQNSKDHACCKHAAIYS